MRNGVLGNMCSAANSTALVFGTVCTTVGCGSNVQILASRSVTTAPLNISSFLPMTKVPQTVVDPDIANERANLVSTLISVLESVSALLVYSHIHSLSPPVGYEFNVH